MISYRYWVRAEVFEHAVVPVSMPQSFSLAGLLKLPAEAGLGTHIRYSEWIQMAGAHLGLSDQTAAALFESFAGLCHSTAQEQLDATRDELAARQDGSFDQWRGENARVPLPPFLLFLLCQQYNRAPSLTGALTQPEPAWPGGQLSPGGRAGSPTHGRSPARDAALRARAAEADQTMSFIQERLYHLLALLAPNKYKVNFYQAEELRYILCEGDPNFKPVAFGTHMPWWQRAADRNTPVDISHVQQFISEGLCCAPRIYPPIELPVMRAPSTRVLWPGMADARETKVAIVKGVNKTVFHKFHSTFPGQVTSVQICCCHQANIYILAPVKNVAICGCTNTNIVLGAVQGAVTIEHCEKVRVVCAARQLRLFETQDARIYACVNTRVQAFGGNRHIELAPYNTVYPALEDHLHSAGINPSINLWNEVLFLSKEERAQSRMVDFLRPDQFSSFVVPFTAHPGRTQTNPCAMPPEFLNELKRKVSLATRACGMLRQAAQDDECKQELSRALNERFRQWLQASGNMRQVLELLHYHDDES
eukprot:Hpha_TRINITY_DN18407_c0_g1::TRINITY_DN18407_c0_g1_i1::g.165325::m.165325/K16810/TBCCD1; TBCC domain-containing protein 1